MKNLLFFECGIQYQHLQWGSIISKINFAFSNSGKIIGIIGQVSLVNFLGNMLWKSSDKPIVVMNDVFREVKKFNDRNNTKNSAGQKECEFYFIAHNFKVLWLIGRLLLGISKMAMPAKMIKQILKTRCWFQVIFSKIPPQEHGTKALKFKRI